MKLTGKILLSTLALICSTMLAGAILSALPLSPPASPPGPAPSLALMVVGSLVLVIGLVPIASGLGGRYVIRWLAVALMLYLATGVNTAIELTIFGTYGGERYLMVFYFLCFATTAAALARLYGSKHPVPQAQSLGTVQWLWRLAIAWLSFPVVYFVFGLCVAPFVLPIYQAGVEGLRVPPLGIIMRTQMLRSLLFLIASLPVIRLWTGSRRRLVVALGLAHTAMVGLYGLTQASFMPMQLRIIHSLEISADSFVYALILAWLFCPRERLGAPATLTTSVASTPSAA
ncbi:MAG: hypothetical protein DMG80_15110 [Acidobacteria bacterium]|nr:MAG: hypothetical protein DMG80_15110 [Acidobacteriota bacterium]